MPMKMIDVIQLSGPYEPRSGGRLVLGPLGVVPNAAPSARAIAYSQSLPADWVSHRLGLVPQVGPVARRWIAAAGPGSFAPLAVMALLNTFRRPGANRRGHFLGECRHICGRGAAVSPGTNVRASRSDFPGAVLSHSERLSGPDPSGSAETG